MIEPSTQILIDRSQDAAGLSRMFTFSVALHVALAASLILVPGGWKQVDDPNRLVMTISLGGAPGPRSGGMTPMGGRPVQAVTPPAEAARPQPVRAPAAKPPEMTAPSPRDRPAPKPAAPKPAAPAKAAPVEAAPDAARGRTPTRGAEVSPGSAIAETGAQGTGFGLSTGGGGTGGYLDVGNFCCPEYLSTMLQLIQRNWNSKQEVVGTTLVKFTIQRDGRLSGIEVERSSGFAALDLTAQRALLLTGLLPPLPAPFTEDHLTVHLNFQYQR